MIKLEIKTYNSREATKISSSEIDKYEYLPGEEIFPSDQCRIIKIAKVYLFSFTKTF